MRGYSAGGKYWGVEWSCVSNDDSVLGAILRPFLPNLYLQKYGPLLHGYAEAICVNLRL